ncbi:hypothetical protein SAMN06265340_10796, partial [Desulfurobacterium atlanticum]
GMNGRTPFEVLKSKWDCLFNLNVACFPVVLLEDVFVVANRLGVLEKGGENVLTPYQKRILPAFFLLLCNISRILIRLKIYIITGIVSPEKDVPRSIIYKIMLGIVIKIIPPGGLWKIDG